MHATIITKYIFGRSMHFKHFIRMNLIEKNSKVFTWFSKYLCIVTINHNIDRDSYFGFALARDAKPGFHLFFVFLIRFFKTCIRKYSIKRRNTIGFNDIARTVKSSVFVVSFFLSWLLSINLQKRSSAILLSRNGIN